MKQHESGAKVVLLTESALAATSGAASPAAPPQQASVAITKASHALGGMNSQPKAYASAHEETPNSVVT